ncbi:MAG TPA: AMP-binding protein, partial [Longimicrobiales bacterium]|nr:AMP-binding protein [Longimicrobiales bacterium]
MSRLLHDLVTDEAARRPEATAIVDGSQTLSFGELEELSSRLAATLMDRGVVRGSRVCMLLPKTPHAVVSILGILKAGGCYVPLDPGSPATRVGKMLSSCDDRFLLASAASSGLVSELLAEPPSLGGWCVGWMESSVPANVSGADVFCMSEILTTAPRPSARLDAHDLAYVMFTSGSTGMPKGVTITHANVLSFIDWAVPYFGIGPDDRNSSHPPLHFDLSVFDVFGSLAGGSELHLVPRSLNLLAAAMVQFIRDSELTQWFSVPSVL